MVQKKGHMAAVKYHLLGLITVVGIVSALWCQSFVSLADSTGKVAVESAKIREKADTDSEVIGSASRGATVTITDEVEDSSGTLWYKVYVDGNTTGYIRSDLVDKQSGDNSSDAGSQSQGAAQSESGASGASIDPGTVMDPQYAAVSANSIKVRTAPSTNDAIVDKLTKDAQVIVSGQSDGSDGKLWYYVTFTGTDGAERTGYIRSDLLSLGDMVPMPEEEAPEPQETAPEPEESAGDLEYELTHEPSVDGSGGLEWYLYDYATGDGNRYRVTDLMAATKARSENDAEDAKTLVRQRIVIVVLIVLLVALIVAVVIMALKLRDVYYEEYEDEEEEETPAQRRRRERETEETSSQRRRREREAEETSSQRRRRDREAEQTSSQRRRRAEEEEPTRNRRRAQESENSSERRRRRAEEDDVSARRRRRMEEEENEADSGSVKTAPKRKTKNFLLDDDEFEFEFLNMDDKNS